MFTGLIAGMGTIESLTSKGGGAVLNINAEAVKPSMGTAIGDSIAVNGVCLTVTNIKDSSLSFDVSYETINSTNLKELRPGAKVNLEPALRADGRLGGHFVTGHVDAVGRIRSKRIIDNMLKIEIEAPPLIIDYLVKKGSIAVDGISLTVVYVLKDSFTIVIIPHTAKETTIGFKNTGDTVNLETDIIGKYVARFLKKEDKGSLMDSLARAGFV